MCRLTETERKTIREACCARIVPGCPGEGCKGRIAFLITPTLPYLTYICLDALQSQDSEGYEIVCRLAGMQAVGTEYWQG